MCIFFIFVFLCQVLGFDSHAARCRMANDTRILELSLTLLADVGEPEGDDAVDTEGGGVASMEGAESVMDDGLRWAVSPLSLLPLGLHTEGLAEG